MRYQSFTIKNYRAIVKPLVIDIRKAISGKRLLPIIGINESGKTTVLKAIFAFDHVNDSWGKGEHLNGDNLYSTERFPPLIEAEIEITKKDLLDKIKEVEEDVNIDAEGKRGVRTSKSKIKDFGGALKIERNLQTRNYTIKDGIFEKYPELSSNLAKKIIADLPYILYFDDFTESVSNEIQIKNDDEPKDPWLNIMARLFEKTNTSCSVFDLGEMEDLRRRSVISDVKKHINNTLAREWSRFSLEDRTNLSVNIEYRKEDNNLLLQVIEEIDGQERYFGIRDRSKGFYWFFNFVMKLEFNPKVRDREDQDTVYLLDEPGSYLHANAQNKLCEKLASISKENVVIYCTHSQYLLNPSCIPISSVRIVQKGDKGSISMTSIAEHSGHISRTQGAFQPLLDALEVRPQIFDYSIDNIVLVEGIYDYYLFTMFKAKKAFEALNFLPAVNAESILSNISFMIFAGKNYVALWDNDGEGRSKFSKAKNAFGPKEGERFMLLPSLRKRKNYRLQDIFAGRDLSLIKRELSLPKNVAFEKVILYLFYSSSRDKMLNKISESTKQRLFHVYHNLLKSLRLK